MIPPFTGHSQAADGGGCRRRQAHGQRQGDDVQQRRIEPEQKPEGQANGVKDVWHASTAAFSWRTSQALGKTTAWSAPVPADLLLWSLLQKHR